MLCCNVSETNRTPHLRDPAFLPTPFAAHVTAPWVLTAFVARHRQQKISWGEDAISTSRSTYGHPQGDGGPTRRTGSATRVSLWLALASRSWPLRKYPRTVRCVCWLCRLHFLFLSRVLGFNVGFVLFACVLFLFLFCRFFAVFLVLVLILQFV